MSASAWRTSDASGVHYGPSRKEMASRRWKVERIVESNLVSRD